MEFTGIKTSYFLLAFSIIALLNLISFDKSKRENLKNKANKFEIRIIENQTYPLPQKTISSTSVSSMEEEKLDEIKEGHAREEELEEIFEEEHEEDSEKTNYYYPDFKESDCSSRIGEKGEFQVIPLVSLPGAGNTWVRFLIEQATGIVTGSVYSDIVLYRSLKGEMTNPINEETIAVKTHNIKAIRKKLGVVKDTSIKPKGCLLIIRSPRDAILAEYVRRNSHSHTGLVGDLRSSLQNSEAWQARSSYIAQNFYKTYTTAVDYCDNEIGASHHLIIYEDLKESEEKLLEVMKNLTDYVNIANKETFEKTGHEKIRFRKECLEKNFEGNYHRKTGRDWDVAEYFSRAARLAINVNVERLNRTFDGMLPSSYKIDMDEWPDRRRRSVENALEYFR